MVSPLYDGILFIGAPILGLAMALALLGGFSSPMQPATLFGTKEAWASVFIAAWTYAHLVAVFFRSHLNRDIYRQFQLRFTVVPILLFVGFVSSEWLMVCGAVLIVFWDAYHTAMQNFGFCRIYDAKQGNFSAKSRRLDIMVNQLLYVGPIIGGLSFAPTLKSVEQFASVEWFLPIQVANFLIFVQPRLTQFLVIFGTLFLAYYVYSYWRMSQNGYRVSPQKVAILTSTGVTSVWAWGFLPPFYAFFVTNFYHALQYFGIVWAVEKRTIRSVIGLARSSHGTWIALLLFTVLLTVIGLAAKLYITDTVKWAVALFMVVSVVHFWYDSFIWQAKTVRAA